VASQEAANQLLRFETASPGVRYVTEFLEFLPELLCRRSENFLPCRSAHTAPYALCTSTGYIMYSARSATHNKYFQFPSYAAANKWLRDRLTHDANLAHKLAPETVKARSALLKAVGITHSDSPRLIKPYPGLFDFSVRPIE
jgi:hypothetical protein